MVGGDASEAAPPPAAAGRLAADTDAAPGEPAQASNTPMANPTAAFTTEQASASAKAAPEKARLSLFYVASKTTEKGTRRVLRGRRLTVYKRESSSAFLVLNSSSDRIPRWCSCASRSIWPMMSCEDGLAFESLASLGGGA